jgi:hypothetical protein
MTWNGISLKCLIGGCFDCGSLGMDSEKFIILDGGNSLDVFADFKTIS